MTHSSRASAMPSVGADSYLTPITRYDEIPRQNDTRNIMAAVGSKCGCTSAVPEIRPLQHNETNNMAPKHLLDGIKVLDFTHYVAGPHCTRLMAEAGADVIKVESLAGDTARLLPVQREGRSGYFIQHNRGKRTLCMDLRKPEAQEICRELVKQVDVVVENFTPGVMKKFSLDWKSLSAINPELIMCSISCLGQEGELAHLPGFDY